MGSRLSKVFHGTGRVSEYPIICHERRLYALAAELWTIAFDVEPALLERNPGWYLDHAARSAALAGCGKGKDLPLPNDAERAKLRGQALTWFRALVSSTAKATGAGRLKPARMSSGPFRGGKKHPPSPAFATPKHWPNSPKLSAQLAGILG